jgi:hypothetical protein
MPSESMNSRSRQLVIEPTAVGAQNSGLMDAASIANAVEEL